MANKFNAKEAAVTRKVNVSIESLEVYLKQEFGIDIEEAPEVTLKKGTTKWDDKTLKAYKQYTERLEAFVYDKWKNVIKVTYFTELTAEEIAARAAKKAAAEENV